VDFNKAKVKQRMLKKEIYELNMTTQNIKEQLNKIWKTSEKRIKQKSWKQKMPLVKQKTHWNGSPLQ
jgi:cell division septum initiation protein DivIVA